MIVVGDIHGTYKTFQKLLRNFPGQQICIVGDLVDRGPSSVDVVQFVMDNQDRIKCVRGNHEEMMIDFYRNGARESMGEIWFINGGKRVYDSYKYKHPQKLERHLTFLESLPYYIEFPELKNKEGRYLVVSHSVIINENIEACVENQSIIWGRRFPEKDVSKGKWFNIFGHTPIETPNITDWWANIDTGSCFVLGLGHLTAIEWPSLNCTMFKNIESEETTEAHKSP